jgi:hypothetical protein
MLLLRRKYHSIFNEARQTNAEKRKRTVDKYIAGEKWGPLLEAHKENHLERGAYFSTQYLLPSGCNVNLTRERAFLNSYQKTCLTSDRALIASVTLGITFKLNLSRARST